MDPIRYRASDDFLFCILGSRKNEMQRRKPQRMLCGFRGSDMIHILRKEEKRMEKAVTRRKWTTGLIIAGAAALVITFWSLIMSMLSLLAVAGVLALLSLPLCIVLE